MHCRAFPRVSPAQLLVLGMLVVISLGMRYIGVLIHEILGHALAAEAAGGECYAVYANPMSGYSSIYMSSATWLPLMYLAGLIVALVIGALALFLVSRSKLAGMKRVYALMFCEGLLIPSALYLSVGAVMSDGDTAKAFPLLGMRPEIGIFIGIWIGIGCSILLSREFARVSIMNCKEGLVHQVSITQTAISHRGTYPHQHTSGSVRSLVLWSPGLLLSLLGVLVSGHWAWLSILYAGTHAALAIAGSLSAVRVEAAWNVKPDLNAALTAAVSFAIVISLWLSAFGPSEDSAHGLLLKPPPPEVEGAYLDALVGNVHVRLRANLTAEVEVRLKPLLIKGSPLDHRIHETFETRPYMPFYAALSSEMVRKMFQLRSSYASQLDIHSFLSGDVRALGTDHPNGRSCIFQVHLNQSYGIEPLDGGGNLTLLDPWRTGEDYLDLLSVEWEEGVDITEITQQGGKPYRTQGQKIIWESDEAADAPYAITLQVTLLSPQG